MGHLVCPTAPSKVGPAKPELHIADACFCEHLSPETRPETEDDQKA